MFAHYLKSLIQLLLSPSRGWEDAWHDGVEPRDLAMGGLYPLIALAAVTELIAPLWNPDVTWLTAVLHVVVTFIMFFAGYFIGIFVLSMRLPGMTVTGRINELTLHSFANFSTGLLALICLADNLVPMDLPFMSLLPLYVIVVQWRGARYMRVEPDMRTRFMLTAAASIVLPVYAIGFLFNILTSAS